MECPTSHPFAFNNSLGCCSRSVRQENPEEPLQLTDPESFCLPENRISCPDIVNKCEDSNNRQLVDEI